MIVSHDITCVFSKRRRVSKRGFRPFKTCVYRCRKAWTWWRHSENALKSTLAQILELLHPWLLIENFPAPGTYDPKHVDTAFKASLIPRRDDFRPDQNPGKCT